MTRYKTRLRSRRASRSPRRHRSRRASRSPRRHRSRRASRSPRRHRSRRALRSPRRRSIRAKFNMFTTTPSSKKRISTGGTSGCQQHHNMINCIRGGCDWVNYAVDFNGNKLYRCQHKFTTPYTPYLNRMGDGGGRISTPSLPRTQLWRQ
jgi:hypothetical protein